VKLLITGGAGYVGAHLLPRAVAAGWEVCTTTHTQPATPGPHRSQRVDLTDESAVRALFAEEQPDAIIHTACSNRTPANIAAIVPAARHIAAAASEHRSRLVHLSTDLVFDGEHSPYTDESPTNPIMPYGKAKAEAEAIVAVADPSAVMVRPSLIWSLDPLDAATTWLAESARNGAPVTLYTDEVRCPVHLDDLVEALLELSGRHDISGPMNMVGPQALNRWEFGSRLLKALGLAPGPNVVSGTIAGSGLVRSRNLTLRTRRAQAELKTRLRGVDEVLGR
jgi:dTDP-4-dehydrorhamnose reductase